MAQDRKNIDQITRTLATLVGTERLPGRDGSGDFKFLVSTLLTYMQNNLNFGDATGYAIGDLKFYADERTATEALGANFADQDGSVINDADSPYNGERNYNFNGGNVVLTLTWTADAGGAYATVSADDLHALDKGDDVSGSGIAADSKITDITGTTVTISDVSASGSISTTFTNDGLAVYGGSGGSQGDQLQGARYIAPIMGGTDIPANWEWGIVGDFDGATGSVYRRGDCAFTSPAQDDGTNGTPRIGTRTRSHARILKVAMRIK